MSYADGWYRYRVKCGTGKLVPVVIASFQTLAGAEAFVADRSAKYKANAYTIVDGEKDKSRAQPAPVIEEESTGVPV